MIKPHKTEKMNITQISLPTVQIDSQLVANINWKILNDLKKTNGSRNEMHIIRNSKEYQQLIDDTERLMEKANHKVKLDEIHYDSNSMSLAAGIFGSI